MLFQARQGLIYNRQSYDPAAGGGGGGGAVAVLGAWTSTGGPLTTNLVTGVTFSTGTAVVAIMEDRGGGLAAVTGVTIKTVSATRIGAADIADGTTNGLSFWRADVTAGTGDIVATTGGTMGVMAANGWMLTGLSSSTPTANASFDGFAANVPDPQGPATLSSLGANSVIVAVVGSNFRTAAQATTWAGGVTRDASTETGINSSNGCSIAGASASGASGTKNITATGATTWQYSGLVAASWI